MAPHLHNAFHRVSLLRSLSTRKALPRPGENPRRLSSRTQGRRLRKPARSQFRIQSRQSPRRRLRIAEIFPSGRSRDHPCRNYSPRKPRAAKRNPILKAPHTVILSEVSASRSEALTQSKDPLSAGTRPRTRNEFSRRSKEFARAARRKVFSTPAAALAIVLLVCSLSFSQTLLS